MARRSRKASPKFTAQAGDLVLIGSSRYTLPSDWFGATVLWTDGTQILTEHVPPSCAGSGEKVCQVLAVDDIRAVGSDWAVLGVFKERSRKAVKELSDHVHECESALGRARSAVWAKLDEINMGGPVRVSETGVEDFTVPAEPEMEPAK